jgi:hypothetical protein
MVFGPSDHQSRQELGTARFSVVTVLPNDSFRPSSYEVVIEPADDPQQLPLVRRWIAVLCLSTAAAGITCAASMVRFAWSGTYRRADTEAHIFRQRLRRKLWENNFTLARK